MRKSLSLVGGLAFLVIGLALVFTSAPFARGPAFVPSPVPFATAGGGASSASSTARPTIPDGYRVQIPRLAIDLPLAEGDVSRDIEQQKTPEGYAFHLPGTSIPGLGSNTYLYAHARTGMFLNLWNAKLGDVVWIATPTKALKYVVSEVHPRVAPDDVSWTEGTPSERLTLQTSTGPDPGDPRFVVIAVPAG
jgi:LPXTG-site transpeptidase (sortase) family protein